MLKTKLEGNGWVETMNDEAKTMVGMTTSILPKEGKTNEYRLGTSKSE